MRNESFLIAAFFTLILGFSACQKAPVLSIIGSTSVDISADGGSSSIAFTANRDWSASCSESWIHISPSSGSAADGQITVSIRCDANTTYDDRSGTVTIKAEGLTQTVSVRQPANKGIIVPTKSYDLSSNANTIEVEVEANVQYSVTVSDSWIKHTGTKALTKSTLVFSIEENTTYDNRSATITLKPQDTSVPTQTIKVKQAQKDALIVQNTNFNMPYGGGEIEIKVESNVSFDVTSTDWIHFVSTKALSNSTIRLTVDENPTYNMRVNQITIKQTNGTLSHLVTVRQDGRIPVSSVRLDKTLLNLYIGDSETIVAIVAPDNATDRTVTWTSNNTSVATVDENGKVTAVKEGSATITAMAGDQSFTCSVWVKKNSGSIVAPQAIDMGLSVKWASFNLRASKPEEYGDLFAWGETESKSYYTYENYKWFVPGNNPRGYMVTKYCHSLDTQSWGKDGAPDNKVVLEPEDDAAHVLLGGSWRIPTYSEVRDLFRNTTHEPAQISGIDGWLLISKINGNSIFVPTFENKLFWTSNLSISQINPKPNYNSTAFSAWLSECLNFGWNGVSRTYGAPIRPVEE